MGLDYEIEWSLSGVPYLTPRGRLVETLSAAIRDVTGAAPDVSTTGGTSDGRFVAEICPEVVEFGPVERLHPQRSTRTSISRQSRICAKSTSVFSSVFSHPDLLAPSPLRIDSSRPGTLRAWLSYAERRSGRRAWSSGHGTRSARDEAAVAADERARLAPRRARAIACA